jgi:hypothetical protein
MYIVFSKMQKLKIRQSDKKKKQNIRNVYINFPVLTQQAACVWKRENTRMDFNWVYYWEGVENILN